MYTEKNDGCGTCSCKFFEHFVRLRLMRDSRSVRTFRRKDADEESAWVTRSLPPRRLSMLAMPTTFPDERLSKIFSTPWFIHYDYIPSISLYTCTGSWCLFISTKHFYRPIYFACAFFSDISSQTENLEDIIFVLKCTYPIPRYSRCTVFLCIADREFEQNCQLKFFLPWSKFHVFHFFITMLEVFIPAAEN